MRRIFEIALMTALVLALEPAGSSYALEMLPTSEMRLLETTHFYKEEVVASSDLVVWGDFRAPGMDNGHLWGYDLRLKQEVMITDAPGWQRHPDMDGSRIVYADTGVNRSSGCDILLTDYRSKITTVICDEPGTQMVPKISGDNVIWLDEQRTQGDILGMNLRTGERFVVEGSQRPVAFPDIAGDWVVYADYSIDRGGDIAAYNIRTHQRKWLATGSAEQYGPSISDKGLVVWQDQPIGHGMNIRGCYVGNGVIFDVAVGSGTQHNCTASGHLAIYNDETRPGGYHLVGYDYLSGKRFGIATDSNSNLYVSPVHEGRMAFISTTPDSKSWVWVAQPTDLDVMSATSAIGDAARQSRNQFSAPPIVPAQSVTLAGIASIPTPVAPTAPRGPAIVITGAGSWQYPLIAQTVLGPRSPLLLTSPTTLSGGVAAELRRLRPSRVIIVGGTSVVSGGVQSQIASIVGATRVLRIGQSSARGVALGVARARKARGNWNGTVLVVSQKRWAGAVTASSLSSGRGYPMLLVGSTGFRYTELRALKRLGVRRVIIIGDTASVPARAQNQLTRLVGKSKVVRLAGKNRYATSAKVASWAVAHESMRWNWMGIVSGETYSRSLLAGWAKGRTNSVLLMTDGDSLSPEAASILRAHQRSVRAADFLGSRSVVSKRVRGQVRMITR